MVIIDSDVQNLNLFDGTKEDEIFFNLNTVNLLSVIIEEPSDSSRVTIPIATYKNRVLLARAVKILTDRMNNKINYHPKLENKFDEFEYLLYYMFKKEDMIVDIVITELPYHD